MRLTGSSITLPTMPESSLPRLPEGELTRPAVPQYFLALWASLLLTVPKHLTPFKIVVTDVVEPPAGWRPATRGPVNTCINSCCPACAAELQVVVKFLEGGWLGVMVRVTRAGRDVARAAAASGATVWVGAKAAIAGAPRRKGKLGPEHPFRRKEKR